MRVALIWPPDQSVLETVPLAFGLLVPPLRDAGHDVRIFNCSLEGWGPDDPAFLDAVRDFDPEVVGSTGWPSTVASAFAAVRALREVVPDAVQVIGGNYASLNPEVTWDTGLFDYVLRFEAETSFPQFLEALQRPNREGVDDVPGIYRRRDDGSLVKQAPHRTSDLDAIANLDYEVIELERYFQVGYMKTVLGKARKAPIFATRGCAYTCAFCTVWQSHGREARHHSAGFLVDQIRHLYDTYGVRHVNFMDDNPTHDMGFWKDFCEAVIEADFDDLVLENHRGVRLEHLDPEMLDLMRRAGFAHVIIAPETGSGRARALMKKTIRTEDIREKAAMIKEAGLGLHGFFILGFPGETAEDRQETFSFIREIGFDAVKIHKFMALPGTAAFQQLVAEGKIARDHTPDGSYLLGNAVPSYVDDDELDASLDREIFLFYAEFFAKAPWRFRHVLHMAPAKMVWRAFAGLTDGFVGSFRRLDGPSEAPPRTTNAVAK